MANDKTEKEVKTLREELDAITFKNAQVQKIKAMQEGKEKLKDRMGRNRQRYVSTTESLSGRQSGRQISAAGRIKGLQTL